MLRYLKSTGAFMVKLGPTVAVRSWTATTLKDAIADGSAKRLRDVAPDATFNGGTQLIEQLTASGWTQQADTGAGFGDVQPAMSSRFRSPTAPKTTSSLASINCGGATFVKRRSSVSPWSALVATALSCFHPIYVETAARDGFVPRGSPYFQRMWDAMTAEDPNRIQLYLASHDGAVLAGTTMVTVGNHAWYSYGPRRTPGAKSAHRTQSSGR